MKVRDLMHTEVQTVRPDAALRDVITTLADAHISGLPVVDLQHRLVGVISTSDVIEAEAEAGDGRDLAMVLTELSVEDVMTPRPVTASPDATIQEAARQMLYADVKRLFVEDAGKLVGVLSQTDIIGAVANGKA